MNSWNLIEELVGERAYELGPRSLYARFWEVVGCSGVHRVDQRGGSLSKDGVKVISWGSTSDGIVVLASLVATTPPDELLARAAVLLAKGTVEVVP